MNIQTTLEQLKQNNVEYIEELYFSYKDKEYHVICKYPNGRIYNQYNALDKGSSLVGPYESIEEAQEYLKSHRAYSTKIWENPEHESAAGNEDLTYYTNFHLSYSVNDFEAAKEYLIKDNMTNYLKTDFSILVSARDKVEHIEWKLLTENSGKILVKTNEYLTEKESSSISNWINGQCSDGLMENFGDFGYIDDETGTLYRSEVDWEINNYELTLEN